jgi:hypothetical protein
MQCRYPWIVRAGAAALVLTAACSVLVPLPATAVAASREPGRGLPLFFVPNRGQAAAAVQYTLRTAQLSVQFKRAETFIDLGRGGLTVRFAGANLEPRIEALDGLAGKVNFLLGDQREDWQTDVPTYAAILYHDLYPGIDLAYSVAQGRLKSEFRVSPGADPAVIRWLYQGALERGIDGGGRLVVTAAGGQVQEAKPDLYQEAGGLRAPVEGGYRLLEDGTVGFNVAHYDRSRALVIDPVVEFSTYLGGGGLDGARAIAVDAAGNSYVAGFTDSSDFPAVNPLQARGGGTDAFVAKLSAAGGLVYCTYMGGSWDDRAFGIAVDAGGSAYATGWTYSPNFPTTGGTLQRSLGGGRDAFAAKLDPAGNTLAYSTYLGGSGYDTGNGIAIDGSGNAYVAGDTSSGNFPVLYPVQGSNGGGQDAFVSKLNPSASALVWSTYLGGSGADLANAIAVGAAGNTYITGGTTSTKFRVFQPLQSSNAGGQDAFVAEFSSDGRALAYCTYLGGSGGSVTANEMGTAIQVDASGNAYVAGMTSSPNFPTVNAFQPLRGGGSMDAFVSKLNPAGSALLYSTYLGGTGVDYAYGIAVTSSGAAAVAGYTSSSNFPVSGAVQPLKSGGYDGYVARLAPAGNTLEMATYWGGSNSEAVYAVAVDVSGGTWIAGQTLSTDLPLKNPTQPVNAGGYGAFVTKLGAAAPVAAFRATNGNTRLTTYGSTGLSNALGTITSDPGISQNATGDSYVVGRNDTTCVYMNIFKSDTQAWLSGWLQVGCQMAGNPAVVATPNGEAYVVARDASYNYWLSHYRSDTGFQSWVFLGGAFASEPTLALTKDGTLYLVGRRSTGGIWSGRYVPATGFQGWVSGGAGAPLAVGQPAIVAGADGAAYVALRSATNMNIWMARLQGDVWGTWVYGGGTAKTDPGLAATGGMIYTAVTNIWDTVYVQAFREGTGNGWQGTWQSLNGALTKASIAATGGRYFVAGRQAGGTTLYWYQSGVGWTYLGYTGLASSELSASPK